MAILTISRQYGSGGREIGLAVAAQISYAYVDKETILADVRKDGKKWEQWARDLDEHCPTVWEKYDWSFRGFAALIQSHLLEHATRNNVVLMGRGGNFLLAGVPFACRIRVEAPLEARIERIMKRESVAGDTARWLCDKTDNDRACFIHSVYGKRWDDPAEYDTVFHADTQSIDEIVQKVKDALTERERFNTEEARNTLRMQALAARVRAGIATNPHFFVPILDVLYDGKTLVLQGVTHNPKEHKRIEEEAKKLAGDIPLICKLHYRA